MRRLGDGIRKYRRYSKEDISKVKGGQSER